MAKDLIERAKAAQLVTYAVTDNVAVITLNRPEKRNALNFPAYAELETALRAAAVDDDVRCVIVTGTDPAFCSGDDVLEIMAAPKPSTPPRQYASGEHPPTPAAIAALERSRMRRISLAWMSMSVA